MSHFNIIFAALIIFAAFRQICLNFLVVNTSSKILFKQNDFYRPSAGA